MKTKLCIALLLVSTINFAQVKKQEATNTNNSSTSYFIKLDDVKGEINDKSINKTTKIGGIEKPYAKSKNDNNQNTNRFWINKKMNNAELEEKNIEHTKNTVIVQDNKTTHYTRRRVVVAKSNKQGDPNKN